MIQKFSFANFAVLLTILPSTNTFYEQMSIFGEIVVTVKRMPDHDILGRLYVGEQRLFGE